MVTISGIKSFAARAYATVFGNNRGGYGIMSMPFRQGRRTYSFAEVVQRGFEGSLWMYRAIDYNGKAFASVPLTVVGPDGTRVKSHPLEKLLARPNRHFGGHPFWYAASASLDLSGSMFIEIVRDTKGSPMALYLLRPDWIKPIPDASNGDIFRSFMFDPQGDGKGRTLDAEDVIWIRYAHPLNPYCATNGMPTIMPSVEADKDSLDWNSTLLNNNAVPGAILKVPAASTMDPESAKELRQMVEAEYTGANRHRPMMLFGGMDWEQISMRPSEMQLLEGRTRTAYEICAGFGVPAALVGANPDPTYANYAVARLAHMEDTIAPRLFLVASMINLRLAPEYGIDIQVRPDFSGVPAWRAAYTEKLDQAKKLFSFGYPINAVNDVLGLGMPKLEWGDSGFLPANMVPVSVLEDGGTSEPASGDQEDDTVDANDTTQENQA